MRMRSYEFEQKHSISFRRLEKLIAEEGEGNEGLP